MKRDNYDATIRFRCHSGLEQRLLTIAEKLKREPSDLYRLAMSDYAEAEERRLKIGPYTPTPESIARERAALNEVPTPSSTSIDDGKSALSDSASDHSHPRPKSPHSTKAASTTDKIAVRALAAGAEAAAKLPPPKQAPK